MSNTSIVNGETVPAAVVARGGDQLYESLALRGDISMLKAVDKVAYYRQLCERLGLDPLTQPFIPLKLNGKEIFYASRAATDQLARLHSVSREVVSREQISDVYIVTVRATLPSGRAEESIGAVAIGGFKGDALSNCLMKAETKAKRRSTLALLGLGLLDESEIEAISPKAVERLTPYTANFTPDPIAIGAQLADADGEPVDEAHLEEKREYEDEHVRLQARLLQEIQTLRDLGIPHSQAQRQMERVTGKTTRADLTNEQLEQTIASFQEWSKSVAEKLRDNK